MQFLPILALGVLMYLLLVRPQQRRVREQRDLVRHVGVGARIQTVGGIVGDVVGAEDDLIHVEVSPGVVITFVRAAVGRIIEQAPADPDDLDFHDDDSHDDDRRHDDGRDDDHREDGGPGTYDLSDLPEAGQRAEPHAEPHTPSEPQALPPQAPEDPEAGPIGGVAS
ncbi:MAG TPA: preprotein translocase subunit YajC [Acidimicrobiales bacterium]|nr:preprotein translocase subunit YajC [Acidimicrobiales bacterium]